MQKGDTVKILYVPLDERPCNYLHPAMLAAVSKGAELLVPPKSCIGELKEPADVPALWEWAFSRAASCRYAILSIDMLVYGNLIGSRTHHLSREQCEERLAGLNQLKKMNPELTIYAFNLVARVANYDNAAEDPDYWACYGAAIWRYCRLMDKRQRKEFTGEDRDEFSHLREEIPREVLDDFLQRREIDRFVNLKCLEYVRAGVIENLVIPKDDNAEYGYAAMDHRVIAAEIYERRLMDRVMVYPGADEVGSVLLARVLNRAFSYTPKVYVRYSSECGRLVVPGYEDRPLAEGVKAQVTSAGGVCVPTPQESDFLLAVNAPGKRMQECAAQFVSRDISYDTCRNLHEFVRFFQYYRREYGRPAAIADAAYCNGADNEFMALAQQEGVLADAAAYCGWNTSCNTVGMCVAHAAIASFCERQGWADGGREESEKFLLRKLIEDWLYQANMRHELLARKDELGFDDFNVGDREAEITELMLSLLREDIRQKLGGSFRGRKIAVSALRLPWHRIYDIDFDFSLA